MHYFEALHPLYPVEIWAPFKLPSYPPDIKYTPKPKRIPVSEQPYSYSAISHIVKKYELYKRASGKFSRRTMDKIRRFNDFCAQIIRQPKFLQKKLSLIIARRKNGIRKVMQ